MVIERYVSATRAWVVLRGRVYFGKECIMGCQLGGKSSASRRGLCYCVEKLPESRN